MKVFFSEIKCLEKFKPLPRDSRLINLNPFLAAEGILQDPGRLAKSNILLEN